MTISESYSSLAGLLNYPGEKERLISAQETVKECFSSNRIECPIARFTEFVAVSSLATIQEEYVATFDFNPSFAPYLGHHLFGDNQKKGEYMIGLKSEFRRFGYTNIGVDLPDHLPVVLGFLAHISDTENDENRRMFIRDQVLPGLELFEKSFDTKKDSPWKPLVEAARILCAKDSEEGISC